MTDLNELYQQMIIDHGRKPRNYKPMEHSTCSHEGYNPLCGDHITVFIQEEKNLIQDIAFQGTGCAICLASASMMTESLKNKSLEQAKQLFQNVHQMLTQNILHDNLGKLSVLSGVSQYPMRVKCATLPWHTLMGAIDYDSTPTTTE